MSSSTPKDTRRRTVIGAALGVVLIGVLVVIVVNRSNGAKVINAGGDTLVLVGEKSSTKAMLSARGRIADVGGCLGWKPENRLATETVVVWPHGTTVQTPDPLRVRVGDETYEIGDEIELIGDFGDPLDSTSYFFDQVPEACRTAETYVATMP